jgi:uncharacterized protein (DUF1501 family)
MALGRRALIASATVGGLVAGGAGLRLAFRDSDEPAKAAGDDILVAVFLRFGVDGLTLAAPAEDDDYRSSRPTIRVTPDGANAGLAIGRLDRVPFYLHPKLPELKTLYDAGHLAILHAAGLPVDTRSHFECQELMERGITERNAPILGGWLARHLMPRSATLAELGAIAAAPDVHSSLQGFRGAVAIPDVADFNVSGGDHNLDVIEALNAGPETHAASARETVAMIRGVRSRYAALPAATGDGVTYPVGEFGAAMRSLSRIIKMDAGLSAATVDFGGWDHHYQMNHYFPAHATQLSQTLAAFWTDLAAYQSRLTIVAMTEFGRRLEENTAGGTDHGAASVMLVMGGGVRGGKLYGDWPGLKPRDLRDGDLRVTTDSRHVLQEILVKRRGEDALDRVFPGAPYRPLGLFA